MLGWFALYVTATLFLLPLWVIGGLN